MWFVSFIPPLTLIAIMNFDLSNGHRANTQVVTYSYIFDVIQFILIVSIVVLLVMTWRGAKTSINIQLAMVRINSGTRRQESLLIAQKKSTRLLTIVFVMICAYIVTYLPFMICRVIYDTGILDVLSISHHQTLMVIIQMTYKSSALFNPILTLILKDDYREILVSCMKGKVDL